MEILSKLLACLLVCNMLFSLSCRDEIIPEKDSKKETPKVKLSNTEIKKEFGVALAKVLKDSPAVRKLIKDEALKQIDFDYDVLYLLVKDERLSDNTTLEEQLLKYVDPELLTLVEVQIPNLTIFVPKLPENSFSAELWDVINEAPCVGIRTRETNDIFAFDPEGKEFLIESQYIPAYPIVVVKECERIFSTVNTKTQGGFISTKSNTLVSLAFLDDAFNNSNMDKQTKTERPPAGGDREFPTAPPPVIPESQLMKAYEAYNIYANSDGWQRDYIYYNISPNSPNGPFNNDFEECLVGLEMVGDPMSCYNKIVDQTKTSDPYFVGGSNINRPSDQKANTGWSEGDFEFKVKIEYASATAAGAEVIKYIPVSPNELFRLGLKMKPPSGSGAGVGRVGTYTLEGMTLKKKELNVPLFRWNLEDYSPSIKITVAEVDLNEVTKEGNSKTVEFAGNFGFDIGWGVKVKKGLKFGTSSTVKRTVSTELTTTRGNDELGEAVASFGDKVIMKIDTAEAGRRGPNASSSKYTPTFNTRYNTGFCNVYIAPLKVN